MAVATAQAGTKVRSIAPTSNPTGLGSGSVSTSSSAPIAVSNDLYPLSVTNFLHLKKREGVSYKFNSGLCFFQPLGCCQDGLVVNGFCVYHLALFNITMKESTSLLSVNGEAKKVRGWRTLVNIPEALTDKTEIAPLFPFIEGHDFDPEKVYLFNTAAIKDMTEDLYNKHVEYFKFFISNDITKIPINIQAHRDMWLNYISAKYNKEKRKWYMLHSRGLVIDLSECTLITQTLIGLFEPSVFDKYAAPSHILADDNHFIINKSACIFGSLDDCFGTILFAPTTNRPKLEVSTITKEISRTYTYKLK